MHKHTYLILALLALFAAELTFYYGSTPKTTAADMTSASEPTLAIFKDAHTGITFEYPESDEGYTLTDLNTKNTPLLEKAVVLGRKRDTLADTAAMPLESAPAIAVSVYKNTDNEALRDWVNSHKLYSNISLKVDEPADLTIGEANAVRYTTDGLYRADNVIIAHGGNMYVLTGSYLDENAQIHKDFLSLLGTIEFIPIKTDK